MRHSGDDGAAGGRLPQQARQRHLVGHLQEAPDVLVVVHLHGRPRVRPSRHGRAAHQLQQLLVLGHVLNEQLLLGHQGEGGRAVQQGHAHVRPLLPILQVQAIEAQLAHGGQDVGVEMRTLDLLQADDVGVHALDLSADEGPAVGPLKLGKRAVRKGIPLLGHGV